MSLRRADLDQRFPGLLDAVISAARMTQPQLADTLRLLEAEEGALAG